MDIQMILLIILLFIFIIKNYKYNKIFFCNMFRITGLVKFILRINKQI